MLEILPLPYPEDPSAPSAVADLLYSNIIKITQQLSLQASMYQANIAKLQDLLGKAAAPSAGFGVSGSG